jgi:hypothetical protein
MQDKDAALLALVTLINALDLIMPHLELRYMLSLLPQ